HLRHHCPTGQDCSGKSCLCLYVFADLNPRPQLQSQSRIHDRLTMCGGLRLRVKPAMTARNDGGSRRSSGGAELTG
ncbi:MAG: hypothetical protein LBH60_02475, partial [Prevotellaceae bacterium]|nr:hypothetical protein [Prevotellaceae bacterium]